MAKITKELLLEGIECNSCINKISKELVKINNVNARIDEETMTLSIEAEKQNGIDLLLKQINTILKNHNHIYKLIEKRIEKTVKTDMLIAKLDCASCANKIESKIRNIAGVREASINFTTKKLSIEVNSKHELDDIIHEAKEIVESIEPDACLIIDEEHEHHHEHDHHHDHGGSESLLIPIIKISLSAILYTIGLIFNFNKSIEFSILLLSYLIIGYDVLIRAFKNILRGQVFDENFLMAIATIGAFATKEYAEAVAVMLFYQVGELFQSLAVMRSRRSISDLMDIRPDYANLKLNDQISKVDPKTINIGEEIVVKAGEKIPLDGVIIDGDSYVDTKALTGEAALREVSVNDEVLSGFINKNGLLTIRVTKVYEDSTVSKILELVENASSKKAKTENFISKFARVYTPIVVISAALLAVIPPLIIQGATYTDWLHRALVFLVISCPCALVISIPLSFFGGIGGSSRLGILVKGGNYLEALNNIDTIVFDKTGTLTKGEFVVEEVINQNGYSMDDVIKYAAYAESYSLHPIALSIQSLYNEIIDRDKIIKYEEISGLGIKAVIDEKEILVGNKKLMMKENIDLSESDKTGTIIYVAIEKVYAGQLIINDEIKKDAFGLVSKLSKAGINNIVMLTGDNQDVALKVAEKLNIKNVHANLLPHEKVDKFEEIKKNSNGKVAFVGDGINDAPVLALSDIGIAMGGLGSDAAIEAADIVIMNDEPTKIITAIKVSKRTRKIVYQNIFFALGIKIVFLALGAFNIASMWHAVIADVGVSLLAILNAMRILNIKRFQK